MTKKKPSLAQREILDLMAQGWELGHSQGINPRWWLQKGGCGHGGESRDVSNYRSVLALLGAGLIEVAVKSFPVTTYRIKEKP